MSSERIFITGAAGFIGSELVRELSKKDYEVHALERHRAENAPDGSPLTHYADITDYQAIRSLVKDIQPDYVIHTAATSAVSYSYDDYMKVSDAGYLATINLAEACHREVPRLKQFIFSGTSEEYGTTLTDKNQMLKEDSELNPNSPYAVAKVASDFYLRYMHKAYGFPFTLFRAYNTYGRKNNTHFFIERTISQMLGSKKVYLGDPTSVRDWLYVDDHVNGFVSAIGNDKALGQVIQLCTGKGYTTEETASLIARIAGFDGEIIWNSGQKRPLDAHIIIGDNTKALKLLGWKPKYTLEEGLRRTISYYKTK